VPCLLSARGSAASKLRVWTFAGCVLTLAPFLGDMCRRRQSEKHEGELKISKTMSIDTDGVNAMVGGGRAGEAKWSTVY
jgi:hypothetical protein